jgi:type II secretory pathway pseudopilin PulG
MHKKKVKISKNSAGFVMVEMLVTISLIIMVLPGALSIATRAITTSTYEKDYMIGTYLAEEGQELMRSVEGRNVLTILRGTAPIPTWDASFNGGKCTPIPCKIDVLNETLTTGTGNLENLSIAPDPSYRLYIDANGFYSHVAAGGTPTPFYRGVFVAPAGTHTDQVVVRSVVVWQTTFGRKKVTSSGFIARWLQ